MFWLSESKSSLETEEENVLMKRKIIGYYNYTVILTYTGMLLACIGVFCSINEKYFWAVLLLMLAGICDMFDGAVASTKKRDKNEKYFGIQIDSLSDLVSFGVLPAIFVYVIAKSNVLSMITACVYILAALIRLAYFNVLEEERQSSKSTQRKVYLGVPVTTIAWIMPAFYILFANGVIKNTVSFILMLFVMAIGFVSPLEIKKPALVGKIVMIVIGVAELVGMLLFRGAL